MVFSFQKVLQRRFSFRHYVSEINIDPQGVKEFILLAMHENGIHEPGARIQNDE
jgi:hypothetical protein